MNTRLYGYNLLLRAFVYFLPFFAFGTASYIRFGELWFPRVDSPLPQSYLILLMFTQLSWILAVDHYKLSSVEDLFWEHTGIRAALFACVLTFLLQAALLVFTHDMPVSRSFIVLSDFILFALIVGARNFFRLTSTYSSWPRKCEKLVIIGTDQYARRCVRLLRRIPFFRCEIQAYVQVPGQAVLVEDAPVIKTSERTFLKNLSFDEVVVALPARHYLQVSSIVDSLETLGKPIRAMFDLGPRLSLREKLFQAGRLHMMSLAISPVESFAYTVLKRTFDLVGASVGLVLVSPLLVFIAIAVKWSSPGPILFRQERVGRHGKVFNLLKFRTMVCGSKTDSDTIWTTKNDPRCTPIGSTLRRFSLDELPQLINVIRGEMSLVGPRPERPYFVAKFREGISRYNLRHSCEVGLTGWAQVHGLRGDTSIPDRLQYDLYYIRNWSFMLDLQIILRTMFIVLGGENGC